MMAYKVVWSISGQSRRIVEEIAVSIITRVDESKALDA